MDSIEARLKQHLRQFAIMSKVHDKSMATHFIMKDYVEYYGIGEEYVSRVLTCISEAYDMGYSTYFHEKFSEKHALVFDIDGEPNDKLGLSKDILHPIYETLREIFEVESSSIRCLVFTACTDKKMSYHIHFPDIIVDKRIMRMVYDTTFKKDVKLRDIIDEQIITSGKLRMAFCDKWDKEDQRPANRRLMYLGTYNCRGLRYTEVWDESTYETLIIAQVRRSPLIEMTPLRNNSLCLASMTMSEKVDFCNIDLEPHDQSDWRNLTPEYYSLQKIPIIIEYIRKTYMYNGETMCNKIVKYMNNFVWMVTDHPGKVIIIIKKYNFRKSKQPWTYVQKSQRDFLQYFQHIKVLLYSVNTGTKASCKTIGDIWLTHADKRCFSTIVFDPRPGVSESHDFNTFQGLYMSVNSCVDFVKTASIDYERIIQPILTHIREIWCSDCPKVYSYTMKWIAHAVLRPWIKMGVALVLVGSEGCGKSILIDAIGKIFGIHYLHITDMEDLVGRFTSLLADKLLVFADEAFWGGCKSLSGKLKGMITESSIRCEHKGFDSYYVDSFSNYIFASNHHHAVPAGENARRWCCLGCTSRYNNNSAYFKNLYSTIYDNDNLGLKCLVAYLALNVNIDDFVPSQFPTTALLRAQKENSFDSLEGWWDQVLHRGYIVPWDQYQMIDPSFELYDNKDNHIKKFFQGMKYKYQSLPIQLAYETYSSEQKGTGNGRLSSLQRFKRFFTDKKLFHRTKPPVDNVKREVWVKFNFKNCRRNWRRCLNDPDMKFDCQSLDAKEDSDTDEEVSDEECEATA